MKLCAWAEKRAYLRSNSKPVFSGHVIGHEMSSGRDFMEALCNLVPRAFPLKVGWTSILPSREKPWERGCIMPPWSHDRLTFHDLWHGHWKLVYYLNASKPAFQPKRKVSFARLLRSLRSDLEDVKFKSNIFWVFVLESILTHCWI